MHVLLKFFPFKHNFDKMNHNSLLFLTFCGISSIQSDLVENCVFQNPFRWIPKLPKCHPYDYCLAFDEHRWQSIEFATKTAYRLNENSTAEHFEVKSEYNRNQFSYYSWMQTEHHIYLLNAH